MRIASAAGALLLAVLVSGSVISFSVADQNKGPEIIEIDGGRKKNIVFPHRRHQLKIDDCQRCHRLFPKQLGSIQKLKASGDLKKKAVMNKLCLNCHRAEKRAGRKAGPTSCAKCHVKAKG